MKTVFGVLDERFEYQIGKLKNYVLDGKCKDFAEYRHECGQIRGLMTAQRDTRDLAKKQMDADDDDN